MQKSKGARLGWAGAHFVKGPAREPRPYPVWSDQEWTNLKVRLKSKNSISEAVRQEILNATSSYVERATSYETLTRGSILPIIRKASPSRYARGFGPKKATPPHGQARIRINTSV
jgi:hypothetical protein